MSIKLSCIRLERKHDATDYMMIDLDDVKYASSFRPPKWSDRIIIFHTFHGDFHWINTLEGIRELWQNYDFVSLDTTNVVNLRNIVFIEQTPYENRAYFKDGTFATVSKPRMHLVQHLPKKDYP